MLIRFVWLFFVFIVAGCATKYNYLPVTSGELVEHSCFSLSYLEEHEQAEWVFYRLTPDMISGKVKRNDNFRVDVKVTSGSATLADYKGSGYDRGHLCPAGSMKLNKKAMSESFLMSNMSPQMPAFNRGMWRILEESVGEWKRRSCMWLQVLFLRIILIR